MTETVLDIAGESQRVELHGIRNKVSVQAGCSEDPGQAKLLHGPRELLPSLGHALPCTLEEGWAGRPPGAPSRAREPLPEHHRRDPTVSWPRHVVMNVSILQYRASEARGGSGRPGALCPPAGPLGKAARPGDRQDGGHGS